MRRPHGSLPAQFACACAVGIMIGMVLTLAYGPKTNVVVTATPYVPLGGAGHPGVLLIPAMETYRGGSGPAALGRMAQAYLARHPHIRSRCSYPRHATTWAGTLARQRFVGCVVTARYAVSYRTPSPTATPRPGPSPLPTAGPTATPTSQPSSDLQYELDLVNRERASHGYAPLRLDSAMSVGSGACVGAQGHAEHMAAAGMISHDQFPQDLCNSYSTGGENVGVAAYGGTRADLDQIQFQMLAEPWSAGCQGNHHCNENGTQYTRVGIGIAQGTFEGLPAVFMSMEFEG